MHEQMNDGPKRPDSGASPQVTSPDMSCLPEEERQELGLVSMAAIAALKSGSPVLIDAAMDKLVDLGAHKVGHALQTLLWSSFQAMLMRNGQPPHDAANSLVMITPDPEHSDGLTEGDHLLCEMASEFLRATIAGAHAAAMDAWAKWVDSLAEDDWAYYQKGVVLLMIQALEIATSEMQPGGEEADMVLGGNSARLVPRGQGQ